MHRFDGNLLEASPRQKRRDRIDVDDLPVHREASRHADDMASLTPFHEEARRDVLLEILQDAERPSRSR